MSWKLDSCQFAATSQGEQKSMAEGFENIEGRHSCNDSSYEHTLEVSDSSNGVYSGNKDK